MADLGTVTYTSVSWTAGDVITEAKMDNMVANDQAYDSHATQGLLLNNNKAYASKKVAGTNHNLLKLNASDVLELSEAGIPIKPMITSAAQGDIFYLDSNLQLTRLGAGTSGLFLQTLGAGANPQWATAGAAVGKRVSVYKTGNQSINNTTMTAVQFDAESFDTDTMHDNSTNNTRITFTTAGVYYIHAEIGYQNNSTGVRRITIKVNDTTHLCDVSVSAANGIETYLGVSCLYSASASDYVEAMAYQSSGGALNVEQYRTFFEAFNIS